MGEIFTFGNFIWFLTLVPGIIFAVFAITIEDRKEIQTNSKNYKK